MAECVVARCVQERRFLKRELQKWGKNVLYLVGLERVAEELMGHEKWITLSQPLLELDSEEVVDWAPNDSCCFCTSRRHSSQDPTKGGCLAEGSDGLTDLDNEQGIYSLGASRANSPSSPDSDQPLDLSLGSRNRSHSPCSFNGEASSSALLKVPQIPDKSGKLKRRIETTATACKRSYTEDELQAALRDIRSGKLGTRRAAVIYGIPRSTLRNKVYKLALDKSANEDAKNKVENSKETKALTMEDLVESGLESGASASESLRRLLRNRMAEKAESKQALLDGFQMFAGLESNPALAPFLSHILANVHQLALSCQSGSSKDLANELKLPLLPDLIRKLSEERFEEECNRHRSAAQNRNSAEGSVILKIPSYKPVKTVNSDASAAGASSQSSSNNGAKGIGVTLREIIAKSINQRTNNSKGSTSPVDSSAPLVTTNGETKKPRTNSVTTEVTVPLHATRSSTLKMAKEAKEAKERKESKCETSTKPEKRVRPKRGRYRNYDRDNLVEAVRAVQRGEMSVHRAGSFFGVPHSTLEYKVKERHLLRPRKHRSNATKSGKSVSVTSGKNHSSSSNSSCSNSNGSTTSSVKGTVVERGGSGGSSSAVTSSPPAGSVTSTNASNLWQNSPLFALDFSRLNSSNFFASQMMRKLQEDALMQGQGTDSLSSRDALLLGVLIRNGLQAAEAGSSK